jgi:hypothetical protein
MFDLTNTKQFQATTTHTWITNQFAWEFGSDEEKARGNTVEKLLVPFIKTVLPINEAWCYHDREIHDHVVYRDNLDGNIQGMNNYLLCEMGRGNTYDKYRLDEKGGVYHEAKVFRTHNYKIVELSWNNCFMASAGSAYFVQLHMTTKD